MKKLQRLWVLFYILLKCTGFFCRPRSKQNSVLIVTPLRLGDFCMWLPFAGALTGYFRAQKLRIMILVPEPLRFMAEKFLDHDEMILRKYPQDLYSLHEMRTLAERLCGAASVSVAASVERAFFYDDLPRIFARSGKFYSAKAVVLPERFWGRLSLWADKIFFRGSCVALTDYENTPELKNYQRLMESFINKRPEVQLFTTGKRGTGTVLAPFSQDPARSCDIKKLARLIPYLPPPVTLVGNPQDAALAAELVKNSPVALNDLCGKTTLSEVLELVEKCAIVCGADSGIANAGIVFGKHVVAFCSQVSRRFMCVPEDFPDHGFVEPLKITSKWKCPYAGCLCRCRFAGSKVYPCVAEICYQDAIEGLETLKSAVTGE